MKIHSITCVSDGFTDEEIASAENFVLTTLSPIIGKIKNKPGTIVLLIQPNKIAYRIIGFSPIYYLRIKNLLRA